MLTFGSLFAGVGGFDYGFEKAGMRCQWQVECEPYCQKVLTKHWPNVGAWDDVRTFPPSPAEDWRVDVICGGFPCQDISLAGSGKGIDGEQSGLWNEYARIICELRPTFAVVENSPALTIRGLGRILGCLAESGYDAEWDVLPAAVFGAHHLRARIFVIAWRSGYCSGLLHSRDAGAVHRGSGVRQRRRSGRGDAGRIHRLLSTRMDSSDRNATGKRLEVRERLLAWRQEADAPASAHCWWTNQPRNMRVVNGLPGRVQRTTAIGNAVVPQVAEWIGRRIIEASNKERT